METKVLVGKNGVYLNFENEFVEFCRLVAKIDSKYVPYFNNLPGVYESFTWKLPLLPVDEINKVIGFFSDYSNKEAIVEIFWHLEEQKYIFLAPDQVVTGSSISYEPSVVPGAIRVGDIHSHNTISAHFSSVDDSDDNRLYGLHFVFSFSGQTDWVSPGRAVKLPFEILGRLVLPEISIGVQPSILIDGVPKADKDYPKEWKKKIKEGPVFPKSKGKEKKVGYLDPYSYYYGAYPVTGSSYSKYVREKENDLDWYFDEIFDRDLDSAFDPKEYSTEKDLDVTKSKKKKK